MVSATNKYNKSCRAFWSYHYTHHSELLPKQFLSREATDLDLAPYRELKERRSTLDGDVHSRIYVPPGKLR